MHAKCPFEPPTTDIRHRSKRGKDISTISYDTVELNGVRVPTFALSPSLGLSPLHPSPSPEERDIIDAEYESFQYNTRGGIESAGTKKLGKTTERCSTCHLVHTWHMCGHDGVSVSFNCPTSVRLTFCVFQDVVYHSSDFGKNSTSQGTVRWYFRATRELATILAEYFRAFFPKYYEKYKKAFDAGVWLTEDTGPFIGRVIVWKLQVNLHQDRSDAGPTVTFPNGMYTGGPFYIPELDLKLRYVLPLSCRLFSSSCAEDVYRYRPGDIVISFSGWLYHTVGTWTPAPVSKEWAEAGLTPGRVSHVFYFPKKSFDLLLDKPKEWALDTSGGKLPSASQFMSRKRKRRT